MNRPLRAIALIDPYWLGPASPAFHDDLFEHLKRQLGTAYRLERVYVYQESDDGRSPETGRIPCTRRVCGRDAIGDGFELVRAMDVDLQQLAACGAYAACVVVTMDDRLALSIERVKASGLQVFGLKTKAEDESDESFRRMARIFDRMLAPAALPPVQPQREAATVSPVADSDADPIGAAIARWFAESDETLRDGAIEFMNSRRGLPRLVDSRLLFLSRELLGRELTEPEKFALRDRFRKLVSERASEAAES